MILKSEVRIGDIVAFRFGIKGSDFLYRINRIEDFTFQATDIENAMGSHDIEFTEQLVSYVPLNVMLLKKIGFVEIVPNQFAIPSATWDHNFDYVPFSHSFVVHHSENGFRICISDSQAYQNSGTKVEYLHELQHYLRLDGVEPSIKLGVI